VLVAQSRIKGITFILETVFIIKVVLEQIFVQISLNGTVFLVEVGPVFRSGLY